MVNEAAQALEAKPKKTLAEILEVMRMRDDEMLTFDPDSIDITKDELGNKLDDIKFVIDQFESLAKYADEKAKEFGAIKTTAMNQVDRIYDRVAYLMKAYEFKKLTGRTTYVLYSKSSKIVLNSNVQTPNSDLYRQFADLNIIKRDYKWDKVAFNKVFESGAVPALKDFAQVVETDSVKFNLNKGIK